MTRFKRQRDAMVQHQLIERGIADERVLDAMREVPREQIVPETHRELSYRAIGVIYRPETERVSHHFETVLPR